jgi:hypothetical protein
MLYTYLVLILLALVLLLLLVIHLSCLITDAMPVVNQRMCGTMTIHDVDINLSMKICAHSSMLGNSFIYLAARRVCRVYLNCSLAIYARHINMMTFES